MIAYLEERTDTSYFVDATLESSLLGSNQTPGVHLRVKATRNCVDSDRDRHCRPFGNGMLSDVPFIPVVLLQTNAGAEREAMRNSALFRRRVLLSEAFVTTAIVKSNMLAHCHTNGVGEEERKRE